MTIYISAPITGYDINERRAYFSAIEDKYKKQGFEVMNPLKNGLDEDATYQEHMRMDMLLLLGCTHMHLDDHWRRSKGCQIEFSVANACGIIIYTKD